MACGVLLLLPPDPLPPLLHLVCHFVDMRGIQCTPWLHLQENAKEEEEDDDVFFGIFLFLLLLLYPLEGAAKERFRCLSGLCCLLRVLGCALAALCLSFFGPSAGDVCLWVHTGRDGSPVLEA